MVHFFFGHKSLDIRFGHKVWTQRTQRFHKGHKGLDAKVFWTQRTQGFSKGHNSF
jgi:hypothetical protein